MGRMQGNTAQIAAWVMSCRAFSRRIEHQCLKFIFENLGAEEIAFDFEATPRNGPFADFLSDVVKHTQEPRLILTKEAFVSAVPALFHDIEVSVRA
jgi:predicted enzyme involved in methoxymalonyl-ACP biosynthesis